MSYDPHDDTAPAQNDNRDPQCDARRFAFFATAEAMFAVTRSPRSGYIQFPEIYSSKGSLITLSRKEESKRVSPYARSMRYAIAVYTTRS
jgi:hypothetical protein